MHKMLNILLNKYYEFENQQSKHITPLPAGEWLGVGLSALSPHGYSSDLGFGQEEDPTNDRPPVLVLACLSHGTART